MKYALYYWLFEPLRDGLRDDPSRTPAISVPVMYYNQSYYVSLLVDEDGIPEALRLTIPSLEEDRIPEALLPLLQLVKEHFLSTLRLGYRDDIQVFPMNVWSFFQEGTPYEVNMRIDANLLDGFDAEKIRSFFVASYPFRHEVRLLIDGNDPRIPVQYRYLSFYKLIEHEFKSKGRWKKTELHDFLNGYKNSFDNLEKTVTLSRYLHELRDKCAHIRTGNTKEILGVNSLNHKETKAVLEMLPILREMCRDLLNRKTSQAFQLGDIRPWYERIEY